MKNGYKTTLSMKIIYYGTVRCRNKIRMNFRSALI
jgi:hypothetical protein